MSIRLAESARLRTVSALVLPLALAVCVYDLSTELYTLSVLTSGKQNHVHWEIAESMHSRLGLQPGDGICQLGYVRGGNFRTYYFARLAGTKIIADIPQQALFWQLDPVTREKLFQRLREAGVKAVVQFPGSGMTQEPTNAGWIKLNKSSHAAGIPTLDNKVYNLNDGSCYGYKL